MAFPPGIDKFCLHEYGAPAIGLCLERCGQGKNRLLTVLCYVHVGHVIRAYSQIYEGREGQRGIDEGQAGDRVRIVGLCRTLPDSVGTGFHWASCRDSLASIPIPVHAATLPFTTGAT